MHIYINVCIHTATVGSVLRSADKIGKRCCLTM